MKTTEIKDTMKLRNEVMYNRGYNVALCQLLCHLARISHTGKPEVRRGLISTKIQSLRSRAENLIVRFRVPEVL